MIKTHEYADRDGLLHQKRGEEGNIIGNYSRVEEYPHSFVEETCVQTILYNLFLKATKLF